ncbi:MAG: hypothetical protein EBS55_00710 [Flavobacteriaceae bacterium]|nr:hypothetical protein [Flavobacteriaceae bacterium]
MKKRLESELISIAHRILKLKNKAEVDQLYKETQKLYEILTILKFYQDNFESVKSEVSEEVLEEKIALSLEVDVLTELLKDVNEEKQIIQPIAELELGEETETEPKKDSSDSEQTEQIIVSEESEEVDLSDNEQEEQSIAQEDPIINEETVFKPVFELEVEEVQTESGELASELQSQEKLEDHIGKYTDPVFIKPNEVLLFPSDLSESELEDQNSTEELEKTSKSEVFNEMSSKSIAIGLNDRIGFVQHLFNDSNEDFNRVISQLNTFDTFEEAKNFINEMVVPDYNYWVGEEDYIERFMEIVEKKFQ